MNERCFGSAKFVFIAIFILAIFFANGCAVVSHGRMARINPNDVNIIKIGQSTKDDIIKHFGKPQQVVYKPNGLEVFVYSHGVERSLMIPLFVLSWGRSAGSGQTFTVTFQEDVVVDYEYKTDERGMMQ